MSRRSFGGAHGAGGATGFIAAIALLALARGSARTGESDAASPAPGTPLRRQASWNAARLLFLFNDLSSPRERHWSLFWKLIQRTSDVEGNHELRVLHRLVVHRDVQGQRELMVNPFFRSFEDARTGEASFDVLKVLYRRERKDGEETVRVLGVPIARRG